MADILRRCGHCGHTLTVSEYADMASLRCPSCGHAGIEALPPPREEPEPEPELRVVEPQPEPVPELQPNAPLYDIPSFVKGDRVTLWLGPMRWRALLTLAHWPVLLLVLIVLGFMVRVRADAIAQWVLYGR